MLIPVFRTGLDLKLRCRGTEACLFDLDLKLKCRGTGACLRAWGLGMARELIRILSSGVEGLGLAC
eukprot:2710433-Pyramimonas_sp.AAC.1